MEHCLRQVVDDHEDKSQSGESEDIGSSNEDEVEDSKLDLGGHVLLLGLLEVELGENVKIVGNLCDEEEFHQEGHVVVRIAFPYGGNIEKILPEDEVTAPEQRDQVEGQQLS